jgi:hypothetical protein
MWPKIMAWLFAAFLAIGAYFSVINWLCINWSRRDKKHHSPIPLLGAWFLGMGLAGFTATRPFWWMCVLIDYGTFSLILALPYLLAEFWNTCSINRLHRFYSLEEGRETTIDLFRRGHALIRMKFDSNFKMQSAREPRPLSLGSPCIWHMSDSVYELDGFGYGSERVLRIRPFEGRYICEDTLPSNINIWYEKLSNVRMIKR